MASSEATVEAILAKLGAKRFSARKMFGEYAVYTQDRVVALVCDDRLYVKVHDATAALGQDCELAPPYPGAKPHYVLGEGEWEPRADLAPMLDALAKALPAPKKRR